MSLLGTIVRRFLARRGLTLHRSIPEIPPTFSEYLESIRLSARQPVSLICFDNEVSIQSDILAVFPPEQVQFITPLDPLPDGKSEPGRPTPVTPAGPFAAVIDLAASPLPALLTRLPWLARAEILLLRCPLGSFWSGETDLCHLTSALQLPPSDLCPPTSDLRNQGFALTDVVDLPVGPLLDAASARPTFVFRPADRPGSSSRPARYRVNEALALLSVPVAQRRDFRLLAGRGSHGFAGGVFNPGAIVVDDQVWLLCRTERYPWKQMKADESLYFAASPEMLLTLGADGSVVHAVEVARSGLPDTTPSRAEDFRLFRFRGEFYSNHSVIAAAHPGPAGQRPLQLEAMQTRVGLSRFDPRAGRLDWLGLPELGRPLARTEKNWAMFTDEDRLFLLYSFSPYVLYASRNWPGLEFAPVLEAQVRLPFDGDGLPVRNSINPVTYDARHWLHLVHKVYPGKRYAFWAVLIDRETLRPVKATARPVVHGWGSHPASLLYTCAVVVRDSEVLLCAGVDDCGTALATINRERLDAEWVAVSNE